MSHIPAGRYLAQAKGFKFGTSSNNTEQIGIEYEIIDGDQAGQRIVGYFSFTDAAAPYTFEKLRRSGWVGEDLEKLDGLGDVEVEIVITEEEYNGKTSSKVGFVNVPGGGGVVMKKPMDQAQQSSFAARMRGHILASKKEERPAAIAGNAQPKF